MSALIDAYCKGFLEERGYSDLKLKYNISFCQGDGLAFEAGFDLPGINILAARLMRGKKRFAAVRAFNAGLIFTLKANDDRYPHHHDIKVDCEYDSDDYEDLILNYDLITSEIEAFFELAESIKDEAQALAYTLYQHCSDLRLASIHEEEVLFEKKTPNTIVRFSLTQDHDFFDNWEEFEFASNLVELAKENDLQIGNLTVSVLDRETDDEIDSYSLGGYTTTKSNPDLRSDCLQILRDLRNQTQVTSQAA